MAFITYPLNNVDYTAEDAELFHCTRTSGIWAENSFPISANGADNNVTVGKGIAWINNGEFLGKVAALKSAEVLNLGIADSAYPRIDVIAIQFNANNNATDVIVKKGMPATNPVRPAIVRSGAVYELYLASVYRPAGATTITASNITDLRMDETVCGLMADSVTKIDTKAINDQIKDLISELESEIKGVKNTTGFMLKSDWVEDDVIPIDKGGTGANTAEGARKTLKTSPVLLWTNPTPSQNFYATSIALPSGSILGGSIYQLFLVVFRGSTTVNRDIVKIARNGVESDAQWIENLYTTDNLKCNGRKFTIENATATFGNSMTRTIGDKQNILAEGSGKLIPVKIYGIHAIEE